MNIPGDQNAQQDANFEDSSAPQNQEQEQNLDSSAQESRESQTQSEANVPFHEHPRFKELIDYRRQSEERLAQYERQMADMQRQYQEALQARQQPAQQVNPLIAKFKEIDPAYGQTMEEIYSKAQSVDEVRRELQELRREKLISQYESSVEKLHNEHKLPENIKSFVKEQLDAMAMQGQIQNLKDIPTAYKAVADKYSKLIEDVKRSERASYVTDKSKDAQAPMPQSKGRTPPRNERGQFTGDRETDIALIAKRALKLSKAEGDL
jgi:hypothetical protein